MPALVTSLASNLSFTIYWLGTFSLASLGLSVLCFRTPLENKSSLSRAALHSWVLALVRRLWGGDKLLRSGSSVSLFK